MLLVGHSYGGVVITEAGNDPKVVGLVYVAAFAPGDGQSLAEISEPFGESPGLRDVKPDAAGFLKLTPTGLSENFAQDLSPTEKQIMIATQGPWARSVFGATITRAAWKLKPSWYIVASNDRMISPDLQRALTQRLKATSISLQSSHVPMLSQPEAVAAFIERAAASAH